jgi:hypothetical protein
MTDERDFIQRSISLNQTMGQGTPTPEELAAQFSLYGARARAARLEYLKGELANREHTPREAAEHLRYERALRGIHEKLVAVGK